MDGKAVIARATEHRAANLQPGIETNGKTCRRSNDEAHGLGALHIVSAWASEEGIALGQVATEAKSNEITAIPELLQQIDLTKFVGYD